MTDRLADPTDPADPAGLPEEDLPELLTSLQSARAELTRFIMGYRSAIKEVETKVLILQHEFQQLHRYNPIEHVVTRLKTMDSIIAKARAVDCEPTLEAIGARIRDIAGVRVVCSFPSDVHRVQAMLCAQEDVELLEIKDYMSEPKPSGYRSLHVIIRVPVFLSDSTIRVPVEIQFRTIAQDFWASLEHKIFYKYAHEVPEDIAQGLRDAAAAAATLDAEMERLSVAIHGEPGREEATDAGVSPEDLRDFLSFVRSATRRQGEPPRVPSRP